MKSINQRRCVSCRTLGPKTIFWRIVRCSETGKILIDQGMGRSAYLCPTQSCLDFAQKKRKLSRSLRIAIAPQIYQTLAERLQDSRVL